MIVEILFCKEKYKFFVHYFSCAIFPSRMREFMADDTNQIFFIITTACLHQCSIKKYNIFFEI